MVRAIGIAVLLLNLLLLAMIVFAFLDSTTQPSSGTAWSLALLWVGPLLTSLALLLAAGWLARPRE
jgi:hypothetical protein